MKRENNRKIKQNWKRKVERGGKLREEGITYILKSCSLILGNNLYSKRQDVCPAGSKMFQALNDI